MLFQNTYTFSYQKTLLHTLFFFVFKIVESFQCILNGQNLLSVKNYLCQCFLTDVKRVTLFIFELLVMNA